MNPRGEEVGREGVQAAALAPMRCTASSCCCRRRHHRFARGALGARVASALRADRGVRAGAAQGEIHNVIASLRLGGASSIGLLQDFKALHDSLCAVSSRTAITEIDTLSYFEPFLALLQSDQTSGVVTHVRPR